MKWSVFKRGEAKTNLRVRCATGHDTTLQVDDVAITHSAGIVTGYRFQCPTCGRNNEITSDPDVLAVLHAFGATISARSDHGVAPTGVSVQREIVSLRVLLDQPEVLAALVAPAVPKERSGSPTQ
jgi:hypothetical protein